MSNKHKIILCLFVKPHHTEFPEPPWRGKMKLRESLATIANRARTQSTVINTEEATKTSLVMPFIQALGYDVFNPAEVIPEFTADVGIKKGEKIDYALVKDGVVRLLIECKPCSGGLDPQHSSQLFRYFAVTDTRFAILTNGFEYHFFTDLDKENRMDARPFFIFNVLDHDDAQINELSRFQKEEFDTNKILSTATQLKYLNLTKVVLKREFTQPGEDFIKLVAREVYNGQIRAPILEMFNGLVKRAIDQILRDRLRERFETALNPEESGIEDVVSDGDSDKSVTTDEEIMGFNIIRAIGSEIVDPNRIVIRDAKTYCAILFDDNNRKPICRLRFNNSSLKIGLFNNKIEEISNIEEIRDIFSHRERIKETLKEYL
jgi:hypothetical protein